MTKPGDFLLGVLDFFAILLPGAIATWLVAEYLGNDAESLIAPGPSDDADPVVLWVVFLLASYTLGHFAFMIGARLDPLYDRWRKGAHPVEKDPTFQDAKELREQIMAPHEKGEPEFSLLKWAQSYILIHSPQSRVEIDRLMADSKFFRSLVPLSVPLALHFAIGEQCLGALGAIVLGALSFVRYREQRWKATELSYATAVILYATGKRGDGSGDGAA